MLDIEQPKLYINGFPKAGLHLAGRMARPMFKPAREDNVWYGTNPWTVARQHLDKAVDTLQLVQRGQYLQGHTGYLPELEDLFRALGFTMLLVYRDLRDVVVSQTYHIRGDEVKLRHSGRHLYDGMSKEEVMLAVINGLDIFDGIFERWATYEPWLDCDFVHAVKFEDMVKKPRWCAKRFIEWIYSIALNEKGYESAYLDKNVLHPAVEWLVFEMAQKDKSITFRKGKTGQWKREFTPKVVKAFKEADKFNALYRLGYVKKVNW